MIQTLIDKVDTVETVRDQIAAILVNEVASQQALAAAASKDPALWNLRVFVDRANPWADYIDAEGNVTDRLPIVNVSLDREAFDKRRSDPVRKQVATATFNVDVYGYGISVEHDDGHTAGDALAKAEAMRAVRLVRNILMAAEYTYLGLRPAVSGRWISSIDLFDIDAEARTVAHVAAARIEFLVDFEELSPQVEGPPLEPLVVTIARRATNEVYLAAEYHSPAP